MATVLIVDDRPVNRDLVRTVLGYQGHATIEAASGSEALQVLHDHKPDLVVSDVLMPGMDGYELARAIRADALIRDVPVLFYTANYVESEIRPIAAAVGVDRIVSKSGDLTELVQAIDDALGTAAPPLPQTMPSEEEFSREHLRVLNAKLLEKITELEEAARLHQMVESIVAVGEDPTWDAVLHRVAASARTLVGARHASLVTVATDTRPSEVVHAGGDRMFAARVDALAAGADVPASPGAHVVPIRIDAQVCANLVLAPSDPDGFTQAEQKLLATFARAAGIAVANSQLYEDARRREEWLAASADVTSTLLTVDAAEAGRLIASGARRVLGADSSWVIVPSGTGRVVIEACDGDWTMLLHDRELTTAEAVLFTEISSSSHPVVIADAQLDERTGAAARLLQLPIGALLAVPLRASGHSYGVLYIAHRAGGPQFNPLDVEMARAFAGRAALTLESLRAEEDRQRLHLAEDRGRIARDLHDVVIQRLFGMGLRLERLRGELPPEAADEIGGVTDDLDRTIDDIRTTIFSLRAQDSSAPSLRSEVLKIVEPASFLLTFTPRLRIEGPIDSAVPEHVHPQLLATLSEVLSNAIRHAHATHVDVRITVDGAGLTLRVTDDGRGVPAERVESGLANLRRRAADLRGTMVLGTGPDGRGTELVWQVPLDTAGGRTATGSMLESIPDAIRFN